MQCFLLFSSRSMLYYRVFLYAHSSSIFLSGLVEPQDVVNLPIKHPKPHGPVLLHLVGKPLYCAWSPQRDKLPGPPLVYKPVSSHAFWENPSPFSALDFVSLESEVSRIGFGKVQTMMMITREMNL